MASSGHGDGRHINSGYYGKQFPRTTSKCSDISEESKDENIADKRGKAGKKDSKYFAHMEGASSEEELVDSKSKSKKSTKVFSKLKDRSKDEKKEEKHRMKSKIKGGLKETSSFTNATSGSSAAYCGPTSAMRPVFGVPLAESVRNSPSHDGVPIPVIFRLCIEYVHEHGLRLEGIYRISAPKSVVEELRYQVDHRREPNFPDAYAAAALLKLFLRELPEPILTKELADAFESVFNTCKKKVECLGRLSDLVERLPACNRSLLAYLFAHMDEVMQKQAENKMSRPCIGLVLQPTLNISQRLLNCFLEEWKLLFAKVTIKRYISPISAFKPTQEFPHDIKGIEEELAKQQSLLNCLHADLEVEGGDPEKTEQLWAVTRIKTQLTRELKRLKSEENQSSRHGSMTGDNLQGPCLEMFEEKQLLAVQMQLREQINAEQRAIDEYKRKIAEIENSHPRSEGNGRTVGTEPKGSEEDWRNRYEDLEDERERLIGGIIEERYRCAHLRACIEMLTLSKQKQHEHEATRL